MVRKWLGGLVLVFVALFGLALDGGNVYAEDDGISSFNIYATRVDCSFYDGSLIKDPCPNTIAKTARVRLNSDGEYKIDRYSGVAKDKIDIEISGNKLIMKPSCSVFNNCSETISVDLKDNIQDTYDALNAALTSKKWYQINSSVGSSYYTETVYYFSAEDVTDPTKVPVAPETTLPEETATINNCMNSGGANTLGWIVCPLMDWLGTAANDAYTEYVEPSLQVNPKLFEGGNDGVRGGWETFRNIANVAFIVLLLAVIFSQLTGVGIDNYGIKKILPKLIVSAILINLSYWICLVFVDLSNIVGNSIQALFNGLGSSLGEPSLNIEGVNLDSVGSTIVSVGVLGALVATGGAAIWANPAIVLSLLISALGVVIAIFFLFILLTVREAAIIVLIVLAPLAVVCYMLPNTKSLFDRWVKICEGLLLVYPICGLLVGGGSYISRLLLSADFAGGGFLEAFTAMIVGIVPIFFIPTVLRNSFSAMGNLGAKISGLGQRASGSLQGAARNSQAYKNAQEMGRMRQTRIRAGINADGSQKQLGRFGTMIRGGKRNVTRNAAQYLKDQEEIRQADDFMRNPVAFEAAKIAQEKKASSDAVANWEMVVDNASQNGSNYDSLINQYREYMRNRNTDGAKAVARVAGRRKDFAAKFMEDAFTGKNAMYEIGANGEENYYNKNDIASVAKELTTGSSSGTYRSAMPLGYSFASQINENPDSANYEYSGDDGWRNQQNVDNALRAFVTKRSELADVKGGGLKEIYNLMTSGGISTSEATRMQSLAIDLIENRDKDPIDLTKAKEIADISGKYRYDERIGDFVLANNGGAEGVDGINNGDFGGVGVDIQN
ncbi:type IV secretion system protein [Candidatus Saccharibacteria bacterium]|nr:type IV secretion system protein [Candidatus Saccharibacteria bacterium]